MAKHEAADVRRQQILEAALACFARCGYHVTRMDDIVQASGLSKGTLYHHFSSKEDIFLGLFDRFDRELWQAWDELDRERPDLAIERQGQLVLQRLIDNRALTETWVEFMGHAQLRERFQRIYGASRERLARRVRSGISQGIFRSCDAQAVAALITALIEGLVLQAVADAEFPALLRWQQGWELILHGIGNGNDQEAARRV